MAQPGDSGPVLRFPHDYREFQVPALDARLRHLRAQHGVGGVELLRNTPAAGGKPGELMLGLPTLVEYGGLLAQLERALLAITHELAESGEQ